MTDEPDAQPTTPTRLIVQMQMSIDGYVSSDVPGAQWQLWDWGPDWPWTPDVRARFNALFASAGGILLSRPMAQEGYLDHWRRTAEAHPDDPDYAFAARIGQLPKFVVTHGSQGTSWPRTTVLTADLSDALQEAKRAVKGDLICFGGAGFATALLDDGLVDELQLYVNPRVAARGASIFSEARVTDRLTLLDATATACGILISRWRPARERVTRA